MIVKIILKESDVSPPKCLISIVNKSIILINKYINQKIMKQTLIFIPIIVFITLIVISCSKSTSGIQPKSIIGKYKWIKTYYNNALSDSNPKTPLNTGNQELLVFNSDNTWYATKNGLKNDSGTFSIGHGQYLAYVGSIEDIYDSVCYYNNYNILKGWDYYKFYSDTLVFDPYISGCFSSYTLPFNGSKWWVKQ